MESTQLAWMAGFFDGEGSFIISIKRPRTTFLTARLGNTDFDAVKLFHETFGGNVSYPKIKTGYRPMMVWSASYSEAEKCARTLLPYLTVKSEQAQLAINYSIYRKTRHKQGHEVHSDTIASDNQYRQMMSDLNHGRRLKI